jgi:hypothetical protein
MSVLIVNPPGPQADLSPTGDNYYYTSQGRHGSSAHALDVFRPDSCDVSKCGLTRHNPARFIITRHLLGIIHVTMSNVVAADGHGTVTYIRHLVEYKVLARVDFKTIFLPRVGNMPSCTSRPTSGRHIVFKLTSAMTFF